MTSKGSHYYKAMYAYPNILGRAIKKIVNIGHLLVEVNSFANPYPLVKCEISSFIAEFFYKSGNVNLIDQYGMQPFLLNVLDKRQTLTEKLVSLIRFSMSENYIHDLAAKIRHFYDLHYLLLDKDCRDYINSEQFHDDFNSLLIHDKNTFDIPFGWKEKPIDESPLLIDFQSAWNILKDTYNKELPAIAFSVIPDEDNIARSFKIIIDTIK